MAYSSHVHVCRMLGSLQIGWISHAVKHTICIQLGSPARGLYHAKCTENNGIRGFYARDCCIEFFTKSIEIVWIFYRPRLEKRLFFSFFFLFSNSRSILLLILYRIKLFILLIWMNYYYYFFYLIRLKFSSIKISIDDHFY